MRTTVNLEPWVLAGLKAMAQRERTTLGKVIEKLYVEDRQPKESRFEHNENGIPLLPNRRKGAKVTSEQVKKLRDATEDSPRLLRHLRK